MDLLIDPREIITPETTNIEGSDNPIYDHREEDMTGYEIAAPEFLPPISVTTDADVYANHLPQYLTSAKKNTAPSSSTEQQAATYPNEGKQLKVNVNVSEVCTSSSSCNDIPQNSIASIQQNQNRADEYEKGGYVQPIEVFNSMAVGNSDRMENRNCLHGAQSGAQKKEVRRREGADGGNPDLLHEENGYISPTEALTCYDLGDTTKMAGNACENPYTATPKAKRRDMKRFDSEVVDCEPGKETSSTTLTAPIPFRDRLSSSLEEYYEDIDVYRNEKRKSTFKKKAVKGKSESMKVQILPRSRSQRPSGEHEQTLTKNQTTIINVITGAEESVSENPTTKHKRAQSNSSNHYTHIDTDTPLVKPDKKRQRRGRHCCILSTILMMLFFLVTVSLAISIAMLLIHVSSTKDQNILMERSESPTYRINTTGQEVLHSLDNSHLFFELQSQLHSLKMENVALQETIERHRNKSEAKLNDIMARQTNMSSQVDLFSSQFSNKLDNITSELQKKNKDSFSSCILKSVSFTKLKSNGIHVETPYKPDKGELEDNFVLFSFCTFIGMDDANLDVLNTKSHVQYRCRCKASKKGLAYKSCTLYYWLCPRR